MDPGQRGLLAEEAMEGEPCGQHRDVEGAPVVGHEARERGELGRDAPQERPLAGIVGQQVLANVDASGVDPRDPGEEDDGARAGGQAGRLGVEVRGRVKRRECRGHVAGERHAPLHDERGSVRGWLCARVEPAGQRGGPVVARRRTWWRRGALNGADGGESIGERPLCEHRLSSSRPAARRRPACRVRRPRWPGRRRRDSHRRRGTTRPPRGRRESARRRG